MGIFRFAAAQWKLEVDAICRKCTDVDIPGGGSTKYQNSLYLMTRKQPRKPIVVPTLLARTQAKGTGDSVAARV